MTKVKLIRAAEIAGFTLIAVITGYGFHMAGKGQEAFKYWLREDGFVENLTVIFLIAAAVIALWRSIRYYKTAMIKAFIFWGGLFILFVFAAGEEISWGQRIFNIETPAFFLERNLQEETNLHNLVIGNVKVNKLIFSQLLFVVLVVYLILLRPLVSRVSLIRSLVAGFQVPLARWSYVVVISLLSLAISLLNLLRQSELIEFVFSVIFILIFMNPIFIPQRKRF
jgi:hypothetical protein